MSRRRIRSRTATLALAIALAPAAACARDEPDAYGFFEATEVVVSAEIAGQVVRFDAVEGARVHAGQIVGHVDTTQIALQLAELRALRSAATSQAGAASAQVAALEARLRSAEREHARLLRLLEGDAATRQQVDRAGAEIDVLRQEIRAASLQAGGARDQTDVTDARIAQLEDRLDRASIRNPVDGTVLTTYVETGEYAQPGQPLYRVADLDTLVLRAYVTGDQLAGIRLGQHVDVRFDSGPDETTVRPGTVNWISDTAEFTPTPIQTREENADLVYAVEVRVPNPDGVLRIGMPGEVVIGGSSRQSSVVSLQSSVNDH